MQKISWSKAAIISGTILFTALLGKLLTDLGPWYEKLLKPSFQPPNWLFGPVWTVIYILTAVSAYLLWTSNRPKWSRALSLYILSLLLNILWTLFFFKLHNPVMALGIILVLWAVLLNIVTTALRYNRLSSYLMIPHFLWVSFAGLINFCIARLNNYL